MPNLISQSLLPEFDVEMANTRKILERVPEADLAFAPHSKSMNLSRLAGHVAEMPLWAVMTLGQDELDLRPNGVAAFKAYELTTTADALKYFDETLRQARALLVATTDDAMMRPWSLKDNGQTFMTLPKVAVMRSFVMNHMIHHRAQLGVYLRLKNVPVPGMYGPSADEQAS
jgi:uncharacterized damage-inducible protein DinB